MENTQIFSNLGLKRILSTLRKAIADYHMIEEGDRIAVGLSGGKDSLVLLAAMANYRLFSPVKFHLEAITIDMGFEGADFSKLKAFCDMVGVEYTVIPTQLYQIIFLDRKESNPCSLCSKMRRGALNTALTERGCNKLALGHHMDDAVETVLLSMFYEGRISSFMPVSFMDRTGVTVIRPLIYTEEKDIIGISKLLPVYHNPCPSNHLTKREDMKQLVKTLGHTIPRVKERIFGAISHPERANLFPAAEDGGPHTALKKE